MEFHISLYKNKKKTLPGHNGPRILSLTLELSLQLKRIQIPASSLLAFLHLAASLPVILLAKHQLQYSMQLLYHLVNPIGDLLVLIEHLHVNLLLHQHLNDNHHLQIALLASSASIELVSSSARVTSAKFQKGLVCMYIVQRPGPIDRASETPGSGKNDV